MVAEETIAFFSARGGGFVDPPPQPVSTNPIRPARATFNTRRMEELSGRGNGDSSLISVAGRDRARAVPLAPARRHVLRQPGEHFLMPPFAILRLQHPVSFIRE